MKEMRIENYAPPLGVHYMWDSSEFTESEKILGAALTALVSHDRAVAVREGLTGCVELQHAECVLDLFKLL